jgi:hypothetical protein
VHAHVLCAAPDRCDRGFVGNTIGQANAVSDKILDLRLCSFKVGVVVHNRGSV